MQSSPTRKHHKKRFPRKLHPYLFTISFVVWAVLHQSPASAQFFSQGETYANEVFPDASTITVLIVGGIRLIFIYLIGARSLRIISGSRGEDKVSDLAMEIAVIFVTILAIDAVLLLVLP